MPFYSYKARNSEGLDQKGRVEATSEEKAAQTLQERGLLVISLTPIADKESLLTKTTQKMTFADTVIFTRQLASMVEAGLTLTNALALLVQQAKPAVRTVLGQILSDLEGGSSFTAALGKHQKVFSKTYIYLVAAGESSGSLDSVLSRLADNMEEQKAFKGKITGALVYPIVVLIVMIAVFVIMMVAVVPKLIEVFQEFDAELPWTTQLLIAISNFMTNFWWLLLILIALLAGGFWLWYRHDQSKRLVDQLFFKIPIIGDLRKKTILTDFTQTMSMLVKSGVPLVDSLTLSTDSVSSINYRDHFAVAKDKVEKGVSFGEALSVYDDFPPIMGQMIQVGEETGKLDDMLFRLSRYFKGEAQQAVAALLAAFEPALMILLGLAVAFLVIAIIMPIYNLTSQIS